MSIVDDIEAAVEQHRQEALELLQTLVEIPSLEGNEKPVQTVVAAAMRAMNLDVDIWVPDDAELQRHPAYVPTGRSYADRPNVIGVLRGRGGGRSLLLNGHVDVVPVGSEHLWTHDPWSGVYVDGRVYGRGSADMKGGVVANLLAAKALQTARVRLKGDLIIESVVDEEAGGNGTLAAVIRGYRGDAMIFTEPTGFGTISVSNRGAQFFRIIVPGQEGGIEYKSELINPIVKAMEVYASVEAFAAQREATVSHPLYDAHYVTKVPTGICKFAAGEWPSTIPSQAVLEGTLECLPGEDIHQVKEAFRQHIMTWAANDSWLRGKLQLEWFGLWFEAAEIAPDHQLVQTLSAQITQTTGCVPVISGAGGCDLRLPVLYGNTPAVLFGPSGGMIHSTDEYVEFEEVMTCAKILAATAVEWCGVA